MPYVEKKFRIKGEKRYRAIAGLSMGGGGTFLYALNHPELFSSAYPLSASTGPLTIADVGPQLKKRNNIEYTEEELLEYFKGYSTLELLKTVDVKKASSIRRYIDCGDDDFLYEGNSLVHIAMKKLDIPHEFRIGDGSHTWTYWRASLHNVLEFASMSFHQF
jgi:S-formylglutathione hydrolase FrmB